MTISGAGGVGATGGHKPPEEPSQNLPKNVQNEVDHLSHEIEGLAHACNQASPQPRSDNSQLNLVNEQLQQGKMKIQQPFLPLNRR
jgi:hypothetical protein